MVGIVDYGLLGVCMGVGLVWAYSLLEDVTIGEDLDKKAIWEGEGEL